MVGSRAVEGNRVPEVRAPTADVPRTPMVARVLQAVRRPWPGVLLMVVVLAVALAIGSGVGSSGHQTDAQRAAALDAQIRCPSCQDLSVAQSSATEAIAVRHQVARLVRQGRTDAQIEQVLVGEWGPTILLRPPARGLTVLVWVLPAAAGLLALVAVAALFWRRSRELARLRGGPT